MKQGRQKPRNIIFFICIAWYMVNLICLILTGNYVFIESAGAYNYISLVLNAIFLFIFYSYLKKGSLTTRYMFIMFGVLVLVPFLIAAVTGGVKF